MQAPHRTAGTIDKTSMWRMKLPNRFVCCQNMTLSIIHIRIDFVIWSNTCPNTHAHTNIWWTASSLIGSHKSPNGSNGNTVTKKKKVKRASENERNKTRTYPFTKWQKAKEKKGRERETTETKNETRSHAFHLISVVGISRNRMDSSTEWSAIVQTNAQRQQQQQDRMRAHLFSPNI